MENYRKGKNTEEELSKEQIPIEILPENFLWMHVKGGTQVGNVIDYAEKAFKQGEYRSVVWSGSGGGVAKTISCAEIMKRNEPQLHQVTRLAYQKIEEYWDPVLSGLDQIVVTRRIPSVHIFLSLDPIDTSTPGYQVTNIPTKFWPMPPKFIDEDYARRKRNQQRGGGGRNQKFNRNYQGQSRNGASSSK